MIPINLPIIGEEEIEAVAKVMRSGPLTNALGAGPMVTQFEKKFAEFAGVKHAIAVNTGTAALHSAVVAAGIKQGDEVILPSFTFVATAEAIVMAGGKPVFVDIDPVTYNIDPKKIEEKITDRTKAIIVVHVHGLPCDMDEINAIAKKHGLKVLEDAAHAHGSEYKGKKAGISIVPSTPAGMLSELLPEVDLILVMTVNPGFGGQQLIPQTLNKVSQLAQIRSRNNYKYLIQVDGGINRETCRLAVQAGADVLVAGSAVFNAQDAQEAINALKCR